MTEEILPLQLKDACWDSVVSSKKLFALQPVGPAPEFYETLKLKLNVKVNDEYRVVKNL